LNGISVVDFLPHSKKENVGYFLRSIRNANPVGRIVLILANFRSHRARATMVQAERLDIDLVFPAALFARSEPDRVHLAEHEAGHVG